MTDEKNPTNLSNDLDKDKKNEENKQEIKSTMETSSFFPNSKIDTEKIGNLTIETLETKDNSQESDEESKKKKFKNFTDSKKFYLLVSFLLALSLWVFVVQLENPVEETLLEVPISFENVPSNMAASDYQPSVKVRVRGNSNVVDALLPRDITAYVDLKTANIGQFVGNVKVELPSKVELVSVNPMQLEVQVQEVAKIQKKVNVIYNEKVVEDGFSALPPVVTPSEVVITGPQDKLEEIASVYVMVDLTDKNSNFTGKLPIYVADVKGESLNMYTKISPADVDVLIPIVRNEPSISLPIKVPLVGNVASGYMVSRVVVEPNIGTVFGDYNLISQLNAIITEGVDVTGAKSNINEKVQLQVPSGTRMYGKTEVDVVVYIDRITKKTFRDVAINVIGDGILEEENINVTISGSSSVIDDMSSTDIKCNVNTSGLSKGKYNLPINFETPAGIHVISPLGKTVEVEVR